MTDAQIIYAVIVALLWVLKADRFVMAWLTANLGAMLLAAGLMDLGVLSRDGATATMMIIDLATGIGLSFGKGTARLIALGYAVTIPIYSLEMAFGVSTTTTVGITLVVAFVQLGVVGLGHFSGGSGGSRGRLRRFGAAQASLAPSSRHAEVFAASAKDLSRGRVTK
jgi:hypothetical protein